MKRDEPITSLMAPNVAAVSVTQTLGDVRRLMADDELHHVPVLRGRTLVGIVSALDMVRLSLEARGSDGRPIEEVMRTDLVTLRDTDTVRDAARHLRAGQLHALPVVNAANELVGIVTGTDLVRFMYDQP